LSENFRPKIQNLALKSNPHFRKI